MNNLAQTHEILTPQLATKVGLTKFEFYKYVKANIMDEMEYPGIRVTMNANVGRLITPLKIDISTGDVITPRAIEFNYDLLLEDRSISLWSYNFLYSILKISLISVTSPSCLYCIPNKHESQRKFSFVLILFAILAHSSAQPYLMLPIQRAILKL